MFSLIVTIISIALVAALALATLYYGGAAELYRADIGAYPLSMDDLVAQKYLSSVPVAAAQPAPAALMGAALADAEVRHRRILRFTGAAMPSGAVTTTLSGRWCCPRYGAEQRAGPPSWPVGSVRLRGVRWPALPR